LDFRVRSTPTDAVIAKKMDNGGPVDIVLLPANGGTEVNLTKDWDLLPQGPFWYPDGKHIYFTGGIGGATHLFRVSPTGVVEQVTKGERRPRQASTTTPDFTKIAYTVGTFERRVKSGSPTSTVGREAAHTRHDAFTARGSR
jgi:Tol biopolymer transport system component